MSIETQSGPSLSKEERKRLKEEKRAQKAAKTSGIDSVTATASPAPSGAASTPGAASGEAKESKGERKRRKEEKRRKKEALLSGNASGLTSVVSTAVTTAQTSPEPSASASTPAANGVAVKDGSKEEKKKRKEEKKRKRAEATGETSNSVSVSQVTTAAPIAQATPEPSNAEERSSKKSKKDKKETASALKPSIPTTFTPEHTAYLESNAITLQPSLYPPVLSIPILPVNSSILSFLSRFTQPTPIQACSWPALLAGRDAVAIAETGSGKTLGFGVPGLQLLSTLDPKSGGKKKSKSSGASGSEIQILVMAPTRELALQSHETLAELGKGLGIGSVCLYGGVGKDQQLRDLRTEGVRIVVGTPGRILDLADSGDMDLGSVRYLVLDEADRMLDQGFENDIRRIIAHTPTEGRQTVMFSATWPESVRRLASTFLNDPIRITVGSDELSANKRIDQTVEVLDSSRDKDSRMLYHLRNHLKAHPSTPAMPTRILVFALYKKEAQRLEQTISRSRFSVAGLHGDMGQAERFKALDKFKRGDVNVLVATDVAARGLDIPDVGLVLNVTFPLTTEDFVHRCGRTGRAGKSGKAVTFFTGENHERSLAGEFMRVLRDVGAEIPKEMDRFPSTIKKKEHGSYGAFYKDTADAPAATKITFD